MASLMVTTVLILVISLIIVGFSQVARRNQREALDRQLSSQAFYAAESGVNQAITVIQKRVAAAQAIPAKTNCAPDSNYPGAQLASADVRVTCLLVEPEVSTLVYDGVTSGASTLVPIVPNTGTVSEVTVTWRPASPRANASATCRSAASPAYTLPESTAWPCGHGLLRLDMSTIPTGNATQPAKTVFLYPHQQSGELTPALITRFNAGDTNTSLVAARCSDNGNDPKCIATIVLPSPMSSYYLNMRSLYRDSNVEVTGAAGGGGGSIRFAGAVKVDVTAKAVDVIKRVRVQISTDEQTGSIHNYGIETSESLCKRFSVAPNYYSADVIAGCPNN